MTRVFGNFVTGCPLGILVPCRKEVTADIFSVLSGFVCRAGASLAALPPPWGPRPRGEDEQRLAATQDDPHPLRTSCLH